MINLISRAEWGARTQTGTYSPLTRTKGVKVHYTGGRVPPEIIDDHRVCVAQVRSFQKFHMDGNGWMDLGYTLCACPHRQVFVGRGPDHLPAANGKGLNTDHYAVLGLVGNAGFVKPNDLLLHAILDAIEYLRRTGGAGTEIKGHRDGFSTDCPGTELYRWIQRGAPRPAPPADPKAWPGRNFRFPPYSDDVTWMSGPDVRRFQEQMRTHGFTLAVDGFYGLESRTGCKTFQRRVKLPDTGIVDKHTWNAAFAAEAKS